MNNTKWHNPVEIKPPLEDEKDLESSSIPVLLYFKSENIFSVAVYDFQHQAWFLDDSESINVVSTENFVWTYLPDRPC